MKKFVTILLTALLVFALIPSAVLGEDEATITLSSVENAKPGDEITITASIAGSYKVHVMNFTFEYDPDALEIISAEQGEFLKSLANGNIVLLDHQSLAAVGRIALGIACPIDPMQGEGELVRFKFRIKDGVTVNPQVTVYVSEFGYMPVGENNSTPVKYTSVNSIITLVNGQEPEGGYDKGQSGYEQGVLTPVPGFTPAPYVPGSDDPSYTDTAGASSEPGETGSIDPNGNKNPNDTSAPGSENNSPGSTDFTSASPAPNGASNNKTSTTWIYILIGVLVAAAAVTGIMIVVKKNKK